MKILSYAALGRLIGPATLILLILAGFLVVRSAKPPAARGSDAMAIDFSAIRAMRDVAAIAVQPHPVSSAEHDRVRDYLVGRLRDLGATPELRSGQAMSQSWAGLASLATVTNIVALIPGTHSSGTILIVAHYDSVPSGPGAGDDASSIAAILEMIRALRAGKPLANDIAILMTDGEELGLLGARWFVASEPSLANIKVVLNFEMRGDAGASSLFQVSHPNALWIDAFAHAASNPHATSLSESVYRLMPNDTDLSVFLTAGFAGMNFAADRGFVRYHTALDDVAHLSRDTLQHQGDYMLAMARQLGNSDLKHVGPPGDEVYFVVGAHLPRYSEHLAAVLALLSALIVILMIVIGIRTGRFAIRAVAVGMFIYFAVVAVAVLEARATGLLMVKVSGWKMLFSGTTYGGMYFEAASTFAIVATAWAIYAAMRRRLELQNLGTGALLTLTLLMLFAIVRFPAGSYMFAWPILFAAIAIGAGAGATNGHPTVRPAIWTLFALLPATILYAPLVAYGDGTALSMMIAAIAAVLLLGFAIPYLDLLTNGVGWIVPAAAAVLAVLFFFTGTSKSGFDALHPHPDSIGYLMDSNRAHAYWISVDYRPDRFTAQFFHDHVHGESLTHLTGQLESDDFTPEDESVARSLNFTSVGGGRAIVGNAPSIALSAPEITVLRDTSADGVRRLKLHARSTRGAPVLRIAVPAGIKVLNCSINGLAVHSNPTNGWSGTYWNTPPEGLDIELSLGVPDATSITIIDQSWGLPRLPDFSYRPRWPEQMPAPGVDFDSSTMVRRSLPIVRAVAGSD